MNLQGGAWGIVTFCLVLHQCNSFAVDKVEHQLRKAFYTSNKNESSSLIYDDTSKPLEDDNITKIVEEILYFLDLGDKRIDLADTTDVIFVVGLPGHGKSTLTQFVANETNPLEAIKSDETGVWSIIDESGTITDPESLISMTFFPNLVVDPITKAAFYDMPGFNDNRNASIEIANSYYVQKIADLAKRIKLAIVTTQDFLSQKYNFPSLFNNILNLVTNVSKFEGGVSIIANKATPREDDQTDQQIIDQVVQFLNNPEVWQSAEKADEAEQLCKILRRNLSDTYTNIGFLRSPYQAGLLSENPIYQKSKTKLHELIWENTEYIEKNVDDFGYELGAEANTLIQYIARGLSDKVVEVTSRLAETAISMIQSDCEKILTLDDYSDLQITLINLRKSNYNSSLSETSISPSIYFDEIINNINLFAANISLTTITHLQKFTNYFHFFRNASQNDVDLNIQPVEWVTSLISIYPTISDFASANVSPVLNTIIIELLTNFSFSILEDFKARLDEISAYDPEKISELQTLLVGLWNTEYPKCLKEQDLSPLDYSDEINQNIAKFGGTLWTALEPKLNSTTHKINFLIQDAGASSSFQPRDWVSKLVSILPEIKTYIESEVKTVFLKNLKADFENKFEDVKAFYISGIENATDVFEKQSRILTARLELEKISTELEQILKKPNSSFSDYIVAVNNELIPLDASFSDELLRNYNSQSDLLEKLGIDKLQTEIDWIQQLQIPLNAVKEAKLWNDFIRLLFQDLATFEQQVLSNGTLSTWWEYKRQISRKDFGEFWTLFDSEQIRTIQTTEQSAIETVLDENKLIDLNTLLDTVLSKFECPSLSTGDIFFVAASFVSFKKMFECPGITNKTKLVIQAYHTIFIDKDFSCREFNDACDVKMLLMAPKWYTRDEKLIDFRGKNGDPPPPKPSGTGSTVGKNGNMGLNGSYILGIGGEFTGGVVTYNVDGGDGGSGQDGQDGLNGRKGDVQQIQEHYESHCNAWSGGWTKVLKTPNKCAGSLDNTGRCHAGDNGVRWDVYGLAGSPGNNGNNGGNGGPGGYPGEAVVYKAETATPFYRKVGKVGNSGCTGSPGYPGCGGSNGDTNVLIIDDASSITGKWCKIIQQQYVPVSTRASNGQAGKYGMVTQRKIQPKALDQEEFRVYIRNYIENADYTYVKNVFLKNALLTFLQNVVWNVNIPS